MNVGGATVGVLAGGDNVADNVASLFHGQHLLKFARDESDVVKLVGTAVLVAMSPLQFTDSRQEPSHHVDLVACRSPVTDLQHNTDNPLLTTLRQQ